MVSKSHLYVPLDESSSVRPNEKIKRRAYNKGSPLIKTKQPKIVNFKYKTYHEVTMLFINVPHPFSIVLKRFYCSQEVLSKIPKPIENNRKWVRWVYNIAQPQHTTRAHTLTAAFRSCVGLE